MSMYVIKKSNLYLHKKGRKDLQFLEKKHGAITYDKASAQIVVDTFKNDGALHVFKSKMKDKFVKDVEFKPLFDNFRKSRAKKRLKKKIQNG